MQQGSELTQVKLRYVYALEICLTVYGFVSSYLCSAMFSVFQALVYYTFGALGGNLVAHMILVS